MFGFSPTCVDAFGEYPQAYGSAAYPMPAYLAAFDGHKQVYLLGFDHQDQPGCNYNVYAGTLNYQNATGAQAHPAFW